jgi:signal peptide peptidase SppA
MMQVVCGVVADWAAGTKSAAYSEQYRNKPLSVESLNGVSVIPIHGVMAKRMNMFQEISGGVSTEQASAEFLSALEDPGVKAIVFDIDSPGGVVNGSFQLADLVYANRGRKPIVAMIDGLGASAAYLLASAADRIIANDAAQVGSIGVVSSFLDGSRAEENAGYKRVTIIGGKYKTAGAPGLSDTESAAYLQAGVDEYYAKLVGRIARNRSVSADVVERDMAQGRVFIGDEALARGLIDEIGGPDAAMLTARSLINGRRTTPPNTMSRGEPRGKDTRMEEQDSKEAVAAQEAAPPAATEGPPVTAEEKTATPVVINSEAAKEVTAHYQAILTACGTLGLTCAEAQAIVAAHPEDTVAALLCAATTAQAKHGKPVAIAANHQDTPNTPTLEKKVQAELDGFAAVRAAQKEG